MIIRILLSLFLLAILIFVTGKAVDLHELPARIMSLPMTTIVELIAITLVISILKGWRFLLLLRNTNIPVTFWQTMKTFIAGQAITPLPGGEAIRGVLLKEETGTTILKTTGPVITQAYLELASATVLMLIGSFVFKYFRFPAVAICLILIGLAIVLNSEKILEMINQKFEKLKIINKFLAKIKRAQKDIKANFYDPDSHLPDKVLVRALGISLIAHLFGATLIWIIAQALGTNLGFFESLFIYSTALVIQGVGTISPGGLGLTEGGMTGILLLFGITASVAIVIVLIFRTITLLFNIFLGLTFLGIFYSKQLLFSKHSII
jgi:uncharacterized protein (TIRG00374 family)